MKKMELKNMKQKRKEDDFENFLRKRVRPELVSFLEARTRVRPSDKPFYTTRATSALVSEFLAINSARLGKAFKNRKEEFFSWTEAIKPLKAEFLTWLKLRVGETRGDEEDRPSDLQISAGVLFLETALKLLRVQKSECEWDQAELEKAVRVVFEDQGLFVIGDFWGDFL